MKRNVALLILFCTSVAIAPLVASAAPITIDTVPVGNAGNAGQLSGAGVGGFGFGPDAIVGAVSYDYRIGTYEVTNDQYVEFLNFKAKSDSFGLYNTYMTTDPHAGITRGGASGSYTYAAKPDMGNKPVNFVTWYDAVRFANWLNNGQGNGDTETGSYTLSDGTSIARNPGAGWVLPSENEWYKAAYYQPSAQGGDSDNYWLFPTATNTVPTVATVNSVGDISNPGANVANYLSGADWNGQDGNVTTVGSAGPLSNSFYGTADQGGNLWEWNEEPFSGGATRGVRGAGWDYSISSLAASVRPDMGAALFNSGVGFRVALITAVPEPSSVVLAALGLVGLAAWGCRRKR